MIKYTNLVLGSIYYAPEIGGPEMREMWKTSDACKHLAWLPIVDFPTKVSGDPSWNKQVEGYHTTKLAASKAILAYFNGFLDKKDTEK